VSKKEKKAKRKAKSLMDSSLPSNEISIPIAGAAVKDIPAAANDDDDSSRLSD